MTDMTDVEGLLDGNAGGAVHLGAGRRYRGPDGFAARTVAGGHRSARNARPADALRPSPRTVPWTQPATTSPRLPLWLRALLACVGALALGAGVVASQPE